MVLPDAFNAIYVLGEGGRGVGIELLTTMSTYIYTMYTYVSFVPYDVTTLYFSINFFMWYCIHLRLMYDHLVPGIH